MTLPLSLVKTQQAITLDQAHHAATTWSSNILDSTTATAILGTDLDGRVEYFNVGASPLTGYGPQEVSATARWPWSTRRRPTRMALGRVGEEPAPGTGCTDVVDPFLEGCRRRLHLRLGLQAHR